MNRIAKLLLPLLVFGFLIQLIAQQTSLSTREAKQAIADKRFNKADSILPVLFGQFIASKQWDSALNCMPLFATSIYEQKGIEATRLLLSSKIDLLKKANAPQLTLVYACHNAAEFYSTVGDMRGAYTICEEALRYASDQGKPDELTIALCEYQLGTFAYNLGNIGLSKQHHHKAMAIRKANATDYEGLYFDCNAIGSLYWNGSKYDSAAFFYNESLKALEKMPQTALNKYYRTANILNNLSALYSALGETSRAIEATQTTIANYQKFINDPLSHPKKEDAKLSMFVAMDNLAGIYKEIGDYGKAGDLLRFSYQKKKEILKSGHPGIFISEILLGQHYNAIREYDSAYFYLSEGIKKIEQTGGDYLFWAGDGYNNMALVMENRHDNSNAAMFYEKADSCYELSYQGDYDNVYMDFLRNASLFYAKNGRPAKAMAKAEKILTYLKNIQQQNSLQGFYQLLNMAELNLLAKQYTQTISFCNKALAIVDSKVVEGRTILDSVKIQVFKPRAMLLLVKARYHTTTQKDSSFLLQLSADLKDARQIIETRKALIDDPLSISLLMDDNKELINFSKNIELDLYKLTNNEAYLDRFLNLHESGIYNRIRSRLDKENAMLFSNIPADVLKEETKLKNALNTSLLQNQPTAKIIEQYIQATTAWENHLAMVKQAYPSYYEMRYAAIFKPLPQLQTSLPPKTTLVRYIFTDSSLYALVADSTHKNLIHLPVKGLTAKISSLLASEQTEELLTAKLFELYLELWQPLAPAIRTEDVVIIPDGILFNLSFELLTPKLVNRFSDLAKNSLLAKHIISYHYSLFSIGEKQDLTKASNYIAFAPVFNDELKNQYIASVKDSVQLDQQYLTLLPQHATGKLVKSLSGSLGGELYLNQQSTKSAFRKHADQSKIIHIGTHAEYNNLSPERSRLLFAKNPAQSNDTNALYLKDIYNCTIRSELTILTACESGKPGYQDGEGMISLAHAFNYAGSQSILTALWKIDEHSSNLITAMFVKNLREGMPANAALRLAKQTYLAENSGRIVSPRYWAGLVLMGNPGELHLKKKFPTNWILLSAGILLLISGIIIYKKSRKKERVN